MASRIEPRVGLRLLTVIPLLAFAHAAVGGDVAPVGNVHVGTAGYSAYEAYQRPNQGEVFGLASSNNISCNQQNGRNCTTSTFGGANAPVVSTGISNATFAANRARRRQSFQQISDENQRAAELRQAQMAAQAQNSALAAQSSQSSDGVAEMVGAFVGIYAQQAGSSSKSVKYKQQPAIVTPAPAPSYSYGPVPLPPTPSQSAYKEPEKPVQGTVIRDTTVGPPQRSAADPPPPPHIPSGGPGCGPTGFC